MRLPIENQQFAARLTAEDLTFVNELIPELLPDRDLADTTITGREIFMAMAETASLKLRKLNQPRPEDSQRINELIAEANRLSEETVTFAQKLEGTKAKDRDRDQEIERLQNQVDQLTEEMAGISTETAQVKENFLKLEKYVPAPNEMRLQLEPFTGSLLSLYAEKIRLRSKVETTAGNILTSLFNRYITKRETELPGFPFLISKQEIINLAKAVEIINLSKSGEK